MNLDPEVVVEYKDLKPDDCRAPFGAGSIPGIGGVFWRGDKSITYLYLVDPFNEDVVHKALCTYGGRGKTLRVLLAEYTWRQLEEWNQRIWGVSGEVPGITLLDTDEGRNRVEVGLSPRRGTMEKLDAALARLGIPKAAIILEHPDKPEMPVVEPDPQTAQTLSLALDIPSQVAYGKTVQLKFTVTNISDETVAMMLGDLKENGYRGSRTFVVTGSDDVPLWMSGGFTFYVASGVSLAPEEGLELTDTWEQVDYLSNEVPPGVYLVYGIFDFSARSGGEEKHRIMEVGPEAITVLEP